MHGAAGIFGAALILVVLWDSFETIILPRRVTRRFRLARFFYKTLWACWSALAGPFHGRRRDRYLSWFGPLSIILLLMVWALGLVMGFALLQWSAGSALSLQGHPSGLAIDAYMSGTTFVTLGLGDVVPVTHLARLLTVIEGAVGFGFLALVIGYMPVLYQAFARREATIALLDARAGSPSTPTELLRRHARAGVMADLDTLLRNWEQWSAELLESHISYPNLSYFRSQHDNQSWLACLTTVMDVCAILIAGVRGVRPWQAQLTFAMARHAVVDLAQIFNTPPRAPEARLTPEGAARLREVLAAAGIELTDAQGFGTRLDGLRRMYEPYVNALAGHLLLSLPLWIPEGPPIDNWRTSAWERRSTGLPPSIFDGAEDEHLR